jgi:hypothetical protein
MKKLSYEKENNYLAKIIKVENLRKHENADRLQCLSVDGNNVITGLDTQEGQICVYFPLECAINKEYLSFTNSFRDKELNSDKEKVGFFEANCRVKAIKLRGERSEGYIVPVKTIEQWFMNQGQSLIIDESDVGEYFDHVLDVELGKKYINLKSLRNATNKNVDKKAKKRNEIVDGQFRLSEDTPQLGKFIHELNFEDIISVTKKIHGCNFTVGKVMCNRELKWYEKVLSKIGAKIDTKYYDIVYASRRVVKGTLTKEIDGKDHYYKSDVWKIVAERLKDIVHDNMTVYGEIVGYTPEGSPIQKNYDYGCEVGELDFYVYRITLTTNDGRPYDFSWGQVRDFCKKMGIKHVPELYYGQFAGLFPQHEVEERFDDRRAFNEYALEYLRDKYLEQKCTICKNDVWDEGIVLGKDDLFFSKFKFKSFNFLKAESDSLDKGEENLEEQEEANVE